MRQHRKSESESQLYNAPISKSKSEHVREYKRKDGTQVRSYNRHPKGTLPPANSPAPTTGGTGSSVKSATSGKSEKCADCSRDSKGHIARSAKAKDEFKKQHPCPATGKSSGSCPGYVIDHVKPLKRGGPDAPENMQWQTKAEAKAKDKTE